MKRLLPLLAIAALVAVPAASATRAAPPTLTAGSLVVGLNPPAVGFQVGTLRGNNVLNPRGYEIDLAKAIAAQLGIPAAKITWINVPWTTLFRPGSKPFDFAFEEATITAARAKVVNFSSSYFDANQGVLMAKGKTSPKSLADLKAMTLCAQADTTGLDYVQHTLRAVAHPDLQHDRRCVLGRPGRPLRRVRDGRADHRLAEEDEAVRLRPDRRPDHHARAVRRGHGQGLEADALRLERDQGADERTARSRSSRRSGSRSTWRRSRS